MHWSTTYPNSPQAAVAATVTSSSSPLFARTASTQHELFDHVERGLLIPRPDRSPENQGWLPYVPHLDNNSFRRKKRTIRLQDTSVVVFPGHCSDEKPHQEKEDKSVPDGKNAVMTKFSPPQIGNLSGVSLRKSLQKAIVKPSESFHPFSFFYH